MKSFLILLFTFLPITQISSQALASEIQMNSLNPDIVMIIDSSQSMAYNQMRIEAGVTSFVAAMTNHGMTDARLYIVTEGYNFDSSVLNHPNVTIIPDDVGSHESLEAFVDFAAGKYQQYGTLRPDSPTEIVVISDNNATSSIFPMPDSIAANKYVEKLSALGLTNYHVHGIVALKDGVCANNPAIGSHYRTGGVYIDLATRTSPSGMIQDLCRLDLDGALSDIASYISSL